MAWYIIANERMTWTKYLVKAEDKKEALEGGRREKYLGYLDGDNRDVGLVGDPLRARRMPWLIGRAMLRAVKMARACIS